MKAKAIFAGFALALGIAAFAGAQALAVQDAAPVIDGAMQKGEYAQAQAVGPFWLGAALSKDGSTLSIGLAAKSTGWIAVGLGSTRMNGAYIVIGFDSNGNATVSENIGKGHGHSPSGAHKVIASALKTANGQTTLEFSIPAAEYVKSGKLDLILGASNKADLVSFHPLFKGVTLSTK
jgi:hypothetical protein